MPGIDDDRLRREIRMEEVLELIGFQPVQRTGAQWYGPCPLHHGSSARSRHFSVNVELGRYTCHKCKSHGHQLELWAAYSKQPLVPASIALCQALKRACPLDLPLVKEPWGGTIRADQGTPNHPPEQRSRRGHRYSQFLHAATHHQQKS